MGKNKGRETSGVFTVIEAVMPARKQKRADFSFGITSRWTSFFGEKIKFGFVFANFDDFSCGHPISYFLNITSLVKMNRLFSFVNELELNQSGSGGSSTSLIILDSASASLGAYQIDFLDAELSRNFKHKFIFTHTSLFVNPELNAAQFTDWTDINERARIIKTAAGRADALFSGHLHVRVITEAGGTSYIACDAWEDGRGFLRVFVRDDGIKYEFKTIRMPDALLEKIFFVC